MDTSMNLVCGYLWLHDGRAASWEKRYVVFRKVSPAASASILMHAKPLPAHIPYREENFRQLMIEDGDIVREADPLGDKPFVFCVETRTETPMFAVDSDSLRQTWIHALRHKTTLHEAQRLVATANAAARAKKKPIGPSPSRALPAPPGAQQKQHPRTSTLEKILAANEKRSVVALYQQQPPPAFITQKSAPISPRFLMPLQKRESHRDLHHDANNATTPTAREQQQQQHRLHHQRGGGGVRLPSSSEAERMQVSPKAKSSHTPLMLSPSRAPPSLPRSIPPPLPIDLGVPADPRSPPPLFDPTLPPPPLHDNSSPHIGHTSSVAPPRFEGPSSPAPLFIPPPPTHVVAPPISDEEKSSDFPVPIVVPVSVEHPHSHVSTEPDSSYSDINFDSGASLSKSNASGSQSPMPIHVPISLPVSPFNRGVRPPSFDAPPVRGPPLVSPRSATGGGSAKPKRSSQERRRDSRSGPVSPRVLRALKRADLEDRNPVRRRSRSWTGRASSFEGPPPVLPQAPAPQPPRAPAVPVLKVSARGGGANTLNRVNSAEIKRSNGNKGSNAASSHILSPSEFPANTNATRPAFLASSSGSSSSNNSSSRKKATSPSSRVPKRMLSLKNKLRHGGGGAASSHEDAPADGERSATNSNSSSSGGGISKLRSGGFTRHSRKANSRSKNSDGGAPQTNWSEVLSKLKTAANTDRPPTRHHAAYADNTKSAPVSPIHTPSSSKSASASSHYGHSRYDTLGRSRNNATSQADRRYAKPKRLHTDAELRAFDENPPPPPPIPEGDDPELSLPVPVASPTSLTPASTSTSTDSDFFSMSEDKRESLRSQTFTSSHGGQCSPTSNSSKGSGGTARKGMHARQHSRSTPVLGTAAGALISSPTATSTSTSSSEIPADFPEPTTAGHSAVQPVPVPVERQGSALASIIAAVSAMAATPSLGGVSSLSSMSGGSVTVPKNMGSTREKILAEIVVSELEYCKGLKTVLKLFSAPLKKKGLLTTDQHNELFQIIALISKFHEALFSEILEPRQNIPAVFERNASGFRCYSPFINSFDAMVKTYERLLKTNSKFASFIRKKRDELRQDFMSFLILPVQRLPRYELLMRELLKNTAPSHPEYAAVGSAIEKIQKSNAFINETKRARENVSGIVALQGRLQGKGVPLLATPGRYFVRQTRARCRCVRTILQMGYPVHPEVESFLFLMNDILLWCDASDYTYLGQVALISSQVTASPAALEVPDFGFQIGDSAQPFLLLVQCLNQTDATEWVADIQRLIDVLQREKNKKTVPTRTFTNMSVASPPLALTSPIPAPASASPAAASSALSSATSPILRSAVKMAHSAISPSSSSRKGGRKQPPQLGGGNRRNSHSDSTNSSVSVSTNSSCSSVSVATTSIGTGTGGTRQVFSAPNSPSSSKSSSSSSASHQIINMDEFMLTSDEDALKYTGGGKPKQPKRSKTRKVALTSSSSSTPSVSSAASRANRVQDSIAGRLQALPKVSFPKRAGAAVSPAQPSFAALSSPAAPPPILHAHTGGSGSGSGSSGPASTKGARGGGSSAPGSRGGKTSGGHAAASLFGTGAEVYAAMTSASASSKPLPQPNGDSGGGGSALPPMPSKRPPTLKKRHDYDIEKKDLENLFSKLGIDAMYLVKFFDERVGVNDIPHLTENDLNEMIPHRGPRSRLRAHIVAMQQQQQQQQQQAQHGAVHGGAAGVGVKPEKFKSQLFHSESIILRPHAH